MKKRTKNQEYASTKGGRVISEIDVRMHEQMRLETGAILDLNLPVNTSLGQNTDKLRVSKRIISNAKNNKNRTCLEFNGLDSALYSELTAGEFNDVLKIGKETYNRQLTSMKPRPVRDKKTNKYVKDEDGNVLYADAFGDFALTGGTAHLNQSKRGSVLKNTLPYLKQEQKYPSYFSVNEFDSWRNTYQLRKWCAAHVEIDMKRGKKNIENATEVLEQVLETLSNTSLPMPSVIVSSGSGGWHLYWLMEDDKRRYRHPTDRRLGLSKRNCYTPNEGGALLEDMRNFQCMLYDTLEFFRAIWDDENKKLSRREALWMLDQGATKDICRVMRIPGSWREVNGERVQCRAFVLSDKLPMNQGRRKSKVELRHDPFEWFATKKLAIVNNINHRVQPINTWIRYLPRTEMLELNDQGYGVVRKKTPKRKPELVDKPKEKVKKKTTKQKAKPRNQSGNVSPLFAKSRSGHKDAVALIQAHLKSVDRVAVGRRNNIAFHLHNSAHITLGCPVNALKVLLEFQKVIGLSEAQLKQNMSSAMRTRYFYSAYNLNCHLTALGIDTSAKTSLSGAEPTAKRKTHTDEGLATAHAKGALTAAAKKAAKTTQLVADLLVEMHLAFDKRPSEFTAYAINKFSKQCDTLDSVSTNMAAKYLKTAIPMAMKQAATLRESMSISCHTISPSPPLPFIC